MGTTIITGDGDVLLLGEGGAGNQDNPKSNRGSSEIKQGTLKGGKTFIATRTAPASSSVGIGPLRPQT